MSNYSVCFGPRKLCQNVSLGFFNYRPARRSKRPRARRVEANPASERQTLRAATSTAERGLICEQTQRLFPCSKRRKKRWAVAEGVGGSGDFLKMQFFTALSTTNLISFTSTVTPAAEIPEVDLSRPRPHKIKTIRMAIKP